MVARQSRRAAWRRYRTSAPRHWSRPGIGSHFIYPGLGYGGSCFPKDVQALGRTAADVGYDAALIAAVETVNSGQKTALFDKMAAHFEGADKLRGKRIAMWGLAFKPNTDDLREAPSRVLIEALLNFGATVVAFDPIAMVEARRIYGNRNDLVFADDKYAALDGADALVICTGSSFAPQISKKMAARLSERNLYTPERLQSEGWTYFSIGRAPAHSRPYALKDVS